MLDLGPPPPPCSLGFRRTSWWAAEPDYPPTTCSGSPARLLVIGCGVVMVRGRGRGEADEGSPGPELSPDVWSRERQQGVVDG